MQPTTILRERIRERRDLPPQQFWRTLREAAGLTLDEVAEAVTGVTAEAVGLWERGLRFPSRRHLANYAAVLQILAENAEAEPPT